MAITWGQYYNGFSIDTIDKATVLSFSASCISKLSIFPRYNKNGSAIKPLESFKKPLCIVTESFTNQYDILSRFKQLHNIFLEK